MAFSFKKLLSSVRKGDDGGGGGGGGGRRPKVTELFTKTDPAVDGDACLHDCDSCSVRLPRGWKIDEVDQLYGHIKGFSTHLVVGTAKSDWVRDVADEPGSVMEAIGRADKPSNGVCFFVDVVSREWHLSDDDG